MRKKFFKDPTLYEGTLNDQNLLPDNFELESSEVIYQLELLLLKEGLLIYSDIKYVNKYTLVKYSQNYQFQIINFKFPRYLPTYVIATIIYFPHLVSALD